MNDLSNLMDKKHKPTAEKLFAVPGKTQNIWKKLKALVLKKYPSTIDEWNFPGAKSCGVSG